MEIRIRSRLGDVLEHLFVQHHGFRVTVNFILHRLLWCQYYHTLILLIQTHAVVSSLSHLLFHIGVAYTIILHF